MGSGSARIQVRELQRIRNTYTPAAAAAKLDLLTSLQERTISQPSLLKSLHDSLCFICAFPDGLTHYRLSRHGLDSFGERIESLNAKTRENLADTGIEGTCVYYRFSYAVALWLARHNPGAVEMDWEELENPGRLDEILRQIVLPGEYDYYASGQVSERQWISQAKGNHGVTDFTWLMAQMGNRRTARFWTEMYDAADLPLIWQVGPDFAKGRNTLPLRPPRARTRGMRKLEGNVIKTITRPLRKVQRLSRPQAAKAIKTAMAALVARHRETYHFNHANPEEVYAADIGQGVQIFVYGLLPEQRFSLETTMGYLIVANGMPVGYGGASVVFHQANTGINIFDEYRGSEATYLWAQVLRTFHHLFGCKYFVVNPYQIGGDNREALRSGAFWFYYKLGFRPVVKEIARLASAENMKIRKKKDYRTNTQTLKQLTQCDMYLCLDGTRKWHFFEEHWLEICAAGATKVLGRQQAIDRTAAARETAIQLVKLLGQKSFSHWSREEQQALLQQAPVLGFLTDLGEWTRAERHNLLKLIRAKGGKQELDYVRIMRKHNRLRHSLSKYCQGI
ncbi:MAG: hypothetical protein QNI91_01975 [Arenicellales bacterium]|nr:hypothetical protein [Arenicellales bacterium]